MKRIEIENKRIKVITSNGDGDYDSTLVRVLKAIPGAAFRTVPERAWFLPLSEVVAAASIGNLFGFDVAAPVRQLAELAREEKKRESEQNAQALAALGDLSSPLPNGRTLFKHQREGAQILIETSYHICADEMGLGKTMQSLVAAKGYQLAHGWRVVVVAPVSLRANWYAEAEGVGVTIEVHSWAKVPDPPDCDFILLADEAHYAQSFTSQRGQRFLALAERARRVFPMTGTPMKNGLPINMLPLLMAARHRLARNRKHFEERYCGAQLVKRKKKGAKGNKASDFNTYREVKGAKNLKELHAFTRDVILRRTKVECLDLPAKTRILREVEASAEAVREYLSVIAAKRNELDLLIKQGKFPEESQALVMLGAIRQAASKVKIDAALEIAEEVTEEDGQIVLFTEYLATAQTLFQRTREAKMRPELLTGATKPQDRQAVVDRFQSRKSNVFIGTIGAGGVGITLTQASTVALVDRAWTPGDNFQAEDRSHRIGQHWPVTVIWLQYGKLDFRIDDLILKKQERIDLVLEGGRQTMRGASGSIISDARKFLTEITEE
ncbi:MAG: DEAD/DEAH box helicase [Blastocatellales bacterium]